MKLERWAKEVVCCVTLMAISVAGSAGIDKAAATEEREVIRVVFNRGTTNEQCKDVLKSYALSDSSIVNKSSKMTDIPWIELSVRAGLGDALVSSLKVQRFVANARKIQEGDTTREVTFGRILADQQPSATEQIRFELEFQNLLAVLQKTFRTQGTLTVDAKLFKAFVFEPRVPTGVVNDKNAEERFRVDIVLIPPNMCRILASGWWAPDRFPHGRVPEEEWRPMVGSYETRLQDKLVEAFRGVGTPE